MGSSRYGKRALRAASSSSGAEGESWKRTELLWFRGPFLREDVDAVARAKSAARAGSLGRVRVGDVGPWPWNCEERSSYWDWRFVLVELSVAAPLCGC